MKHELWTIDFRLSTIDYGLWTFMPFEEYDYSPYNCFSKTIESEPGKFRSEHLENRIPMVYSLVATIISA